MNVRRAVVKVAAVALCLTVVFTAGCDDSHNVAEVDGQLLINGKPGNKVLLQFIPDKEKGTTGPTSTAKTDAEGRFTLQWMEKGGTTPHPGAVVGWHRVVLSDLQLAESATGRGVPIRFGSDYTLVGSTPLMQEVTEGKQTIVLRVPK